MVGFAMTLLVLSLEVPRTAAQMWRHPSFYHPEEARRA